MQAHLYVIDTIATPGIYLRASPVLWDRRVKGIAMQIAPGLVKAPHKRQSDKRQSAGELQRADPRTVLLAQVKAGRCEQSFNRLYEYYSPRLRGFLRQKGVPDRISQEITQEVMASVWEKAHQFDPRCANASTWIFTIARNRYVDLVRKERRSDVDLNDPLLAGDAPAPADAELTREDEQRSLKDALAELPEAQAKIVSMIYIDGMKQTDVAERLDIPLNTVKSRLRLALQKLRSAMESV
jgi:RNA polymerase sigma-70 factor, ECF subfamily